jgi:hypothetical protein
MNKYKWMNNIVEWIAKYSGNFFFLPLELFSNVYCLPSLYYYTALYGLVYIIKRELCILFCWKPLKWSFIAVWSWFSTIHR